MYPTFSASTTSMVNPLSGIEFLYAPVLAFLTPENILAIIYGVVFFIWLIFSLVTLYHWLRYGHRSPFAIFSFLIYLVGSGVFFIMAYTAF